MRTRVHFALATLSVVALASAAMAGDGPTVGGQLEVNYTYNFNKPTTRNNTFLFNNTDGEFTVNLGEINVKKAATNKAAGYTFRVMTGRVQKSIDMAYNTDHVLEAYGTTLHEMGGKTLTFDFGQFLSHVGYETPDVGSGQFFSKSFCYQLLQPLVHAGVRGSVPLGENNTLMGVITNRFDGVNDVANRDLGFGFQFVHKSSEAVSWTLNAHTARENLGTAAAPVNRDTSVANLIYSNKLNDTLSVAVDATSRTGKDATNRSYNATGVAGYLSKKLVSGNTLSVRGEYLSQNNATSPILPLYPADPTRKPSMTSITAAYEIGSSEGSRTIIEFRMDNAGGAMFPASTAGTVKKQQTSISLSRVFKF